MVKQLFLGVAASYISLVYINAFFEKDVCTK